MPSDMAHIKEIDRSLKIVIPLEKEDGTTSYVYARPFSRAAFSANYLLLAQVWTAIQQNNVMESGPTIAALMLRDVARRHGTKADAPDAPDKSILAEIRRTAEYQHNTEHGWQSLPLESAVAREHITQETIDEIENILVFFTVVSAVAPEKRRGVILTYTMALIGVSCVSGNFTDFLASLEKSKEGENTGATETTA